MVTVGHVADYVMLRCGEAVVSQVSVTQTTVALDTLNSAAILSILLQTERALKCNKHQLLSLVEVMRGLASFPALVVPPTLQHVALPQNDSGLARRRLTGAEWSPLEQCQVSIFVALHFHQRRRCAASAAGKQR
jgi:hypothetical protein